MGLEISDPCFEINGKWEKRKIYSSFQLPFMFLINPGAWPSAKIKKESMQDY